MPTIRDMLSENLIIEELEAVDKRGVLYEFAHLLKSKNKVENEEELLRVLLEREALGSTGIGDGVAIPHGKLPMSSEMIIAFGRSKKGIDFQAMDSMPVHLFFVLVTPEDRAGDHLKALARISRVLKNPDLREGLKTASTGQELQRLIYQEDSKYPQPPSALKK
jgi:PTS system nitrogen regulatory IIA component